MARTPLDPNARRALDDLKLEIAQELGISNNLTNSDSVNNIFTAGPVGGMMTRKLVEMGQKELMDNEKQT